MGLIKVKSTLGQRRDGGWPLAFFERDAAHPQGEAFIAGPDAVEVAETPAVLLALGNGQLERVETDKPTDKAGQTKASKPLTKWTKAELLTECERLGLNVPNDATNAMLVEMLTAVGN